METFIPKLLFQYTFLKTLKMSFHSTPNHSHENFLEPLSSSITLFTPPPVCVCAHACECMCVHARIVTPHWQLLMSCSAPNL